MVSILDGVNQVVNIPSGESNFKVSGFRPGPGMGKFPKTIIYEHMIEMQKRTLITVNE